MPNDLARTVLALRAKGAQIVYGVATALNTVTLEGSASAVVLPAISPVSAGAYCAVLVQGADRIILGAVGAGRQNGKVGFVEVLANRGPFTALADIAGLNLSFTGVAGRLYHAVAYLPQVLQNVSNGQNQLFITDGGGAVYNRGMVSALAGWEFTIRCEVYFTTGSGLVQLKCQYSTTAGNTTVTGTGTARNFFLIEDVGLA